MIALQEIGDLSVDNTLHNLGYNGEKGYRPEVGWPRARWLRVYRDHVSELPLRRSNNGTKASTKQLRDGSGK